MNKIAASKLDLLTDCIPRKLNNIAYEVWRVKGLCEMERQSSKKKAAINISSSSSHHIMISAFTIPNICYDMFVTVVQNPPKQNKKLLKFLVIRMWV